MVREVDGRPLGVQRLRFLNFLTTYYGLSSMDNKIWKIQVGFIPMRDIVSWEGPFLLKFILIMVWEVNGESSVIRQL